MNLRRYVALSYRAERLLKREEVEPALEALSEVSEAHEQLTPSERTAAERWGWPEGRERGMAKLMANSEWLS